MILKRSQQMTPEDWLSHRNNGSQKMTGAASRVGTDHTNFRILYLMKISSQNKDTMKLKIQKLKFITAINEILVRLF